MADTGLRATTRSVQTVHSCVNIAANFTANVAANFTANVADNVADNICVGICGTVAASRKDELKGLHPQTDHKREEIDAEHGANRSRFLQSGKRRHGVVRH
jgi:hypothetical protein